MSVTFSIRTPHMVPFHGVLVPSGTEFVCEACGGAESLDCEAIGCYMGKVRPEVSLNVANTNAIDLLRFLGLPVDGSSDLMGEIRACELRSLLSAVEGRRDTGRLGEVSERLIVMARAPERMQDYLRALSDLCDRAGDLGIITWG